MSTSQLPQEQAPISEPPPGDQPANVLGQNACVESKQSKKNRKKREKKKAKKLTAGISQRDLASEQLHQDIAESPLDTEPELASESAGTPTDTTNVEPIEADSNQSTTDIQKPATDALLESMTQVPLQEDNFTEKFESMNFTDQDLLEETGQTNAPRNQVHGDRDIALSAVEASENDECDFIAGGHPEMVHGDAIPEPKPDDLDTGMEVPPMIPEAINNTGAIRTQEIEGLTHFEVEKPLSETTFEPLAESSSDMFGCPDSSDQPYAKTALSGTARSSSAGVYQQEVPLDTEEQAEDLFGPSDGYSPPWGQHNENISTSQASNENIVDTDTPEDNLDSIFNAVDHEEVLPWDTNLVKSEEQANTVILHTEEHSQSNETDVFGSSDAEDNGNSIFGGPAGDDFLTGLKKAAETADKFAFLAEDLDDDLLDDELLEDEQLENLQIQPPQETLQSVTSQQQPLQRTESQLQPQQRKNYNPYAANSGLQPQSQSQQAQQNHLDIQKLNENKKKSDAYDFPVDLMPKKHYKKPAPVHVQSFSPQSAIPQPAPNPLPVSVPPPNPYAPSQGQVPLQGANASIASYQPIANQYTPTGYKAHGSPQGQFRPSIGLKENVSLLPQAPNQPSIGAPKAPKKQSSFFEELPIVQNMPPKHARSSSIGVPSGFNSPLATAAITSPTANMNLPSIRYPANGPSQGPVHGGAPPISGNSLYMPVNQAQQPGQMSVGSIYGQQPMTTDNGYTFPGQQKPQQPIDGPVNNYSSQLPQGTTYISAQQPPNPALSPLLNQLQPNRLPLQGLTVNTGVNSSASGLSPAQPTPSASRYAPINHRRQASATANNYDPYSLSKAQNNQVNQKFMPTLPNIQGQDQANQVLHQTKGFNQTNGAYGQVKMPSTQQGHPQPGYTEISANQPIKNPEQLLRRQFPLFSWGHGNKLAYFIPGSGLHTNGIKILETEDVLKEQTLKEFPIISKKNIPSILKYLDHCSISIENSTSPNADKDEVLLIQLLKHKLVKSGEVFDYGAIFNYQEVNANTFNERAHIPKQELNKRHFFGLLATGQKEQAIELALQHEDFAMALFVSGLVDKPTWMRIVDKYLHYAFKGDQNGFLPILLNILIGDSRAVVDSFRSDQQRRVFALTHWKELTAAVISNNLNDSNLFFGDYADFLFENGLGLAAHIVFFSGNIPLRPSVLSCSLKSILYSEIYALALQEMGKILDLTELYINHAYWLVDYSLTSEAQRYIDLATSSIKSTKNPDNKLKIALEQLNEQISGISAENGSWLARPKFEKLWGHVDKSLNTFISGDEAPAKPKEGVFSKFSPGVSRNSSFVSVTQAASAGSTSVYDPNSSFASRQPVVPQASSRAGSLPQLHNQGTQFNKPANVSGPSGRPPFVRTYTPHTEQVSVSQHGSPNPSQFGQPPRNNQVNASRNGLSLSPKLKMSKYAPVDSRRSSVASSSHGEELFFQAHHSFDTQSSSALSQVSENGPQHDFDLNPMAMGPHHRSTPLLKQPLSSPAVGQPVKQISTSAPPLGAPRGTSRNSSRTRTPRYVQAPTFQGVMNVAETESSKHAQSQMPPAVSPVIIPGPAYNEDAQEDQDREILDQGGSPPLNKSDVIEQSTIVDSEIATEKGDEIASHIVNDFGAEFGEKQQDGDQLLGSSETAEEPLGFESETVDKAIQESTEQFDLPQDSEGGMQPTEEFSAPCYLAEEQGRSNSEQLISMNPFAPQQTSGGASPLSKYIPPEDHYHTMEFNPPAVSSKEPLRESYASITGPGDQNLMVRANFDEQVLGPTQLKQDPPLRTGSIPVNPYAPPTNETPLPRGPSNTYSTPGPSRKSSYVPVAPNESNFRSYRAESNGDAGTLNSTFNPGDAPGTATPQASKFEPLQPPNSIDRAVDGSPSTRFNVYQPPTTSHNITKIGEEDEEYYDDLVDDDDDDEDEDDDSTNGKPEATEEKKKSSKGTESNGSGWFGWLRKDNNGPKVYKAHLGENSSFYYDENLKRWINPNASPEELEKLAAPTPPPPIIKKKPNNLGKPRSDSAASGSQSPTASLSGALSMAAPRPNAPTVGRKSTAPADLDSLLSLGGTGGPPTGRGAAGGAGSRRKKGRGYVDVMSQFQDKK